MHVPDWLQWFAESSFHLKHGEELRKLRHQQLRHDRVKLIEQLNDLDRDLRTRFSCNRIESDSRILQLTSTRTAVLAKMATIQGELALRLD